MPLPEQIQKQVDEAKSIIEKHYGPPSDKPAEPAASGDAPAAPVAEAAPPAPPAEPAQHAPAPSGGEDDKTFEQRWRSLQGIYNATKTQLQNSEARMRAMEEALVALQTKPAEPPPARMVTLTDEERETFGESMINFTRKLVSEAVTPLESTISALRDEIASLKGLTPVVSTLVTRERGSAEEKFFAAISQAVPDWQTINADSRFHAWLFSPDAMTGITRQTYLEDAQRTFDSSRAVSIFKAWQRESGENTVAPGPTPPAKPNPASELERQVAPGRVTASAPVAPQQGRQWTPDDVTAFYADITRGAYRGRDAERIATERDLFQAQRDGRFVRRAA